MEYEIIVTTTTTAAAAGRAVEDGRLVGRRALLVPSGSGDDDETWSELKWGKEKWQTFALLWTKFGIIGSRRATCIIGSYNVHCWPGG